MRMKFRYERNFLSSFSVNINKDSPTRRFAMLIGSNRRGDIKLVVISNHGVYLYSNPLFEYQILLLEF